MEAVFDVLAMVVEPLAGLLVMIQPTDSHEKHFFVKPHSHIFEFFVANLIFITLTFWGIKPKSRSYAIVQAKPLHPVEHILRFVLTINLILQVVYKTIRGWRVLGYMLQPCHVATTCYLYTLYTKDHNKAQRVFEISFHYMFFTILAILVPDLSQLQLPYEQTNFWVQHWFILLTPLCLLFYTKRFHLVPDFKNSLLAIGIGGLFHFDVQLPVALITGINVNYMLWPPPGLPSFASQPNYRYYLTAGIVTLAFLSGYVFAAFFKTHRPNKEETVHNSKKKN
eukprot:TRINITY_DN943_c0_g1_i1.p1 TRINITY_DN943_c0_g1~~TRINITY_DN943_c0_g1_i1.p1  ORF type:complete len:281 (+),score=39.16 TRINITY_DN943_c0_g1_i1:183-1025(+)